MINKIDRQAVMLVDRKRTMTQSPFFGKQGEVLIIDDQCSDMQLEDMTDIPQPTLTSMSKKIHPEVLALSKLLARAWQMQVDSNGELSGYDALLACHQEDQKKAWPDLKPEKP